MVTTTYHATSRKLLAQSREELTRGDVLQASEKGWGAAAQMSEGDCRTSGLGAW